MAKVAATGRSRSIYRRARNACGARRRPSALCATRGLRVRFQRISRRRRRHCRAHETLVWYLPMHTTRSGPRRVLRDKKGTKSGRIMMGRFGLCSVVRAKGERARPFRRRRRLQRRRRRIVIIVVVVEPAGREASYSNSGNSRTPGAHCVCVVILSHTHNVYAYV
jgi:hypothetical protein